MKSWRRLLLKCWLPVLASALVTSCAGTGKVAVGGKDASTAEGGEAGSCALVCQGMCGQIDDCACGTCPEDQICSPEHECTSPDTPPTCVQFCKALGRECGTAGADCDCGTCGAGEECSDGLCLPIEQDTCCPWDYEVLPETTAEEEWVEDDCESVCVGAEADCGQVGDCLCGECPEDWDCVENTCIAIPDDCIDECKNKECGEAAGCDCGECEEGLICNKKYKCEPAPCEPKCTDPQTGEAWECGENSCGGQCGFCIYGGCVGHFCECTPECGGKQCGSDGCGGSCGVCAGSEVCAWNGQCYADCDLEAIGFSDMVQKLTTLAAGKGGHPGEALDVDHDMSTCAPKGDCEAGLDNQMSSMFKQLAAFVDIDSQLQQTIDSGEMTMLLEFVGPDFTGKTFLVNIFLGEPVNPKNVCNFQTSNCDYYVMADSIDLETCMPLIAFDNAKILDNVLYGGGPGYKLSLMLPLMPGIPFVMELHHAQIVAPLTIDGAGNTTMKGILAGAIVKQELLDAVDQLPNSGLPISKDMIKNLLDMMLTADMDTDGDGVKDAASMGLKFNSIEGTIAGVAY